MRKEIHPMWYHIMCTLLYTIEVAEFLRTNSWLDKLLITVIVMPEVLCCHPGTRLADGPKLVILCSAACYCCPPASER